VSASDHAGPPAGEVLVSAPSDDTPAYGTPAPGEAPARRRRWPRRVALGLLALFVLAIAYYAVTFAQVRRAGQRDDARPADAIVVMGAAQYFGKPSPILKDRLDHTLSLWKDGTAPLVFTTGGKLEGDRFTEGGVAATYLTANGVPADQVLRETRGRTSYESLAEVAKALRARGLRRVVLVSDPYHMLRIVETSRELGLEAWGSPVPESLLSTRQELRREAQEAAGIAVARLPLMSYRRLWRLTG